MAFVTSDINISFEIPKMSLMLVIFAYMWNDLVNLQENNITLVTNKIKKNRQIPHCNGIISTLTGFFKHVEAIKNWHKTINTFRNLRARMK